LKKKSRLADRLLLGGLIGGYIERSGELSHAEGLVLPSRAAKVSASVGNIKCLSWATYSPKGPIHRLSVCIGRFSARIQAVEKSALGESKDSKDGSTAGETAQLGRER
jgi:hypothetical protein